MTNEVRPYNDSILEKKSQVKAMFNNIARKYDFLNHFLSLGVDRWWRRKAISILKKKNPRYILDVATGTADLAFEALRLKPEKIVGVDISEEMLKVGEKKVKAKNVENIIELKQGDSENLKFANNNFDAVTVAFGVRNFENLNKGLVEMLRVLKKGGKIVILEFSKPRLLLVKWVYNFYIFHLLPFFGRYFSKDKSAYTYLPRSVMAFPEREMFIDELHKAGFAHTKFFPLTLGIVCIYIGEKI